MKVNEAKGHNIVNRHFSQAYKSQELFTHTCITINNYMSKQLPRDTD
jgi:hypothetical protein